MEKINIGVQCSSIGERCGIATYAKRLNMYLNEATENSVGEKVRVNSEIFYEKPPEGTDVIIYQYEPGLLHPRALNTLLEKNPQVSIITAHHISGLVPIFNKVEGIVVHSEKQLAGLDQKPWNDFVIPHPALIYEDKDTEDMREIYDLPKDKKIVGTAGFIAGTSKLLPYMVENLLKKLNDDEFLYFITSTWKGGDANNKRKILNKVKEYGKEDQFRIDTEFVKPEVLNEKMQACDLLFSWSANTPGSQSGIAADMYGSRTKLIVKDSPHYSFIGSQEGVVVGDAEQDNFADDVLELLRSGDLSVSYYPDWLSWEEQVKKYITYAQEFTI